MVLWFCYQHPQTPWLPKWISVFVVAYALSPIDLIPDFIPVLGYLDDVIILPLGILLAIRLMPVQVLEECQVKASEWEKSQVRPPARDAGYWNGVQPVTARTKPIRLNSPCAARQLARLPVRS